MAKIKDSHDFQEEINNFLQQYGLPVRCGRRVRTDGDCAYDSVLSVLEDRAIRQNISERAKNANLCSCEDFRIAIAQFMDTNKELQKLWPLSQTVLLMFLADCGIWLDY